MKKLFLRVAALAGAALLSLDAGAVTQIAKGAFAYDVRLDGSTPDAPVVTYKLNAVASAVTVNIKVDGQQVATKAGTTDQTNTVTFSGLRAQGTITAEVVVTTPDNSGARVVYDTPETWNTWRAAHPDGPLKFACPKSVAVNNCTESATFGQVLVSDVYDGGASTPYYSTAMNSAGTGYIYAFDPQMQGIANTAKGCFGFKAGIPSSNAHWTDNVIARLRYADDGRLFAMGSGGASAGLWQLDADNLDNNATKIGGITGGGFALDTWGKGDELWLATSETSAYVTDGSDVPTLKVWGLGSGTNANLQAQITPSGTIHDGEFAHCAFDKDGYGIIFGTNVSSSGTPARHYQYASHTLTDNTTDDPTGIFGSSPAMVYNADKSLVAVANSNNIYVYRVTWNAQGSQPTFGPYIQIINMAAAFGCSESNLTTDLAFDYANNLYMVNTVAEVLVVAQLPTDWAGTVHTTPTRTVDAYQISSLGVPELHVDLDWDASNNQTATVTWGAVANATQYKIYDNGSLVATTTDCNVRLPYTLKLHGGTDYTGMPARNIEVSAVVDGTESDKSAVVAKFAPFPDVVLTVDCRTGADGVPTAVFSWTSPAFGLIDHYNLYNRNPTTGEEACWTSFTGNQNSYTIQNVSSTPYLFRIEPCFTQIINTTLRDNDYWSASNITGEVSAAACLRQPIISSTKTYDGYNSVTLDWTLPEVAGAEAPRYYNVYRDGILSVAHAEYTTCVDMKVPNGTHNYVVEAVYADKAGNIHGTAKSAETQLTVHRDHAVTAYGLEEVYNYHIFSSQAQWQQNGSPANAVVAGMNNVPANLMDPVGFYGLPGDVYRQAVLRNGKWYIAQLTDRSKGNNAFLPNAHDADDLNGTYHGGICMVDADDPRSGWSKIFSNEALVNQSIAAPFNNWDGSVLAPNWGPRLFIRGRHLTNTNPLWYYDLPNVWSLTTDTQASNPAGQWHYDPGYNYYGWGDQFQFVAVDDNGDVVQGNRVHYLTADGDFNTLPCRLFMPMNRTNKVVVASLNFSDTGLSQVSSGAPTAGQFRIYEGPFTATDHTSQACTEQYATPITGRQDFLHLLRTEGMYYVNAQTGEYTTVYSRPANCTNAGAITFAFNDELFIIDPTCTMANNTGHFRIDMPKRPNATAGIDQADFTDLIPMVAFTQDDLSITGDSSVGNAHATWFGTEEDTDENCVYIYQYVPGVRFAKYKFFPYNEFPPVEPTLNMAINQDADHKNVTDFEATITWDRPAEYAQASARNYEIDHYDVRLLDANEQAVATWSENDPNNGVSDYVAYFQNTQNWDHVYCWVWDAAHGDQNYTGGTWPGVEIQKQAPNMFYTWSGTVTAANPNMKIIFSNGKNSTEPDAHQTADLDFVRYGLYNADGWENTTYPPTTTTHFTKTFNTADGVDYPLDWQNYTAEVVPVFHKVSDPTKTLRGEAGYAINNTDYEAAVNPLTVKGFIDPNGYNGKPLYRVDIDFDRASLDTYPMPVSHFELQYRPDGTGEWRTIPGLRLLRNDEIYFPADETGTGRDPKHHDGNVWGDYKFGNEPAQTNPSNAPQRRVAGSTPACDKSYAQPRPEADATPVVGFHVTTQNPMGNEYRVTAVYAAGNQHIRKTAEQTATLNTAFTPTGITDIMAGYPAYDDADAQTYDLQGRRLTNPAPGTVVIRRQGSQVQKTVTE